MLVPFKMRWATEGRAMSMRRAVLGVAAGALVVLGASPQPAGATHAGATADCGSAGAFTVKAQDTGAGVEFPDPGKLVLFEEGGALTVLEFYVEGELLWSAAQTGRANNNVTEVTCTFRNADPGELFTVVGVLTA
jgi:hypothetical protein